MPEVERLRRSSQRERFDKLCNSVLFDEVVHDRFYEEIPLIKLNTLSVVSERLRVLASLAKAGLHELLVKSLIRCVVKHRSQLVCTRAISKATEAAVVEGYGEEKPHFDLLVLRRLLMKNKIRLLLTVLIVL